MIVDTSAIIAVLRNEPDAIALGQAIEKAAICRISAVTYVEAGVVTDSNKDAVLSRKLDDLLRDVRMRIESVTPGQAQIARQAYRDFGKGRHKAGLNFGDCFAYALAKDLDEPLLFKGRDFNQTDIDVAEY
jgi:ribonuclease VapC